MNILPFLCSFVLSATYSCGPAATCTIDYNIEIPYSHASIVEEIDTDYVLSSDDLSSLSYLTPELLETGLKYDLKPLAATFIEAEEKYNVNAIALAAIAALESGWGRYQFKDNNLFGFGNKEFDSAEECILYVAQFIQENYLSPDGRYYGGGTKLKHINKAWNGSQHWLTEVKSIAEDIKQEVLDNVS